MSKKQQVFLDNGDDYFGHLNDKGQPHGFGRSVSRDGTYYEGIWKNGRRQTGKGVSALGPWYDGEWKDDMPDGKGKGMSCLGQYFEGHLEQGNIQRGNLLMRVECVVADCPAAVAPLQMHQRVIPRELAMMLGRPAGNCDLFHATFRTQNYEGSGRIEGTGTLADEANDGPILYGAFREVGNALDIVEMDMPHLVSMTPEQEALRREVRRSEQLQRLAIAKRKRYLINKGKLRLSVHRLSGLLHASACDAQALDARTDSIAKGQRKLDNFKKSKKKDHEGGHRKYRRMRNITRRRHCK